MKNVRVLAATTLLLSLVPAVAFAGVTFKNKEKKAVELSIHRSGSTQETAVPGGVSMDIPGSPMTITVKLAGKQKGPAPSTQAEDGDTVTWEKGKLTRQAADDGSAKPDETPAEGSGDATPAPQ